jgi:hypothetical protein
MIFNNSIEKRLGLRYFSGGGGSSKGSTTPQATPEDMLKMYNQYLPQSLATTTNQVAPVTNVMAGSAAGANPIYTASGLNQLNTYAPGYAKAGTDLAQQQTLGAADNLAGAGGMYALMGAGLTNLLNPAQSANNTQASNLVNSINLNGLSGGEQNAVERSLNQSNALSGNLGLGNATNAVSNAMNFGNALQAKRVALGNALGASNAVAQSQNTAFNPVNAINTAGNTAQNFGLSQFNPTQANATLSTPFSFASSFGNQLAGVSSASKGTTTSANASGGCYLTTACCEYKGLPDNCEELETLRKFRDEYVPAVLVVEYYKTAPNIVPLLTDKELEYIYGVVTACVKDIKEGKKESALNRYTNMVAELQSV